MEARIGNLAEAESGVVIFLLLFYRAVNWRSEMIDLLRRMPPVLASTALVQEQLGLALNRLGRGEEVELVLRDVIYRLGASTETYGILGRVLKDRSEQELNAGAKEPDKELLERAADAYLKGFDSDWRDAYPVNAVTLMELKEPPDPRRREIVPVVYYAVEQRIRSEAADTLGLCCLVGAEGAGQGRGQGGRHPGAQHRLGARILGGQDHRQGPAADQGGAAAARGRPRPGRRGRVRTAAGRGTRHGTPLEAGGKQNSGYLPKAWRNCGSKSGASHLIAPLKKSMIPGR